jgi:hypothetical protein
LPNPIQEHAQPKKSEQQQLVEKPVRYHGVTPSHGGEMGVSYLFFRLGNYPQDRGTRPVVVKRSHLMDRRLAGLHHADPLGMGAWRGMSLGNWIGELGEAM